MAEAEEDEDERDEDEREEDEREEEGEEGEEPEGSVTLTIALFIRLLEFARESAKDDLILHDIAENAARLVKDEPCLDIDDYPEIIKRRTRVPKIARSYVK